MTTAQDRLERAGARIGEFAGVATALSFGDTPGEFRALRQDAGLFDLGWRGKLVITGGDRIKWLNGMVTNNIRDLALDHGTYNFLLNAQGHILADMYLYNRGEYILLDTDQSQLAKVHEVLEQFVIMDDVELGDAGAKLSALGLAGPRAAEVLKRAGIDVAALQPLQVADGTLGNAGISVVAKEHGFEVWAGTAFTADIWDALLAAGATPVGAEARELWRISLGTPRFQVDIRERDLPQETRQERALNFSKGCYIGQEIVERIRSRGAVHRQFTGFWIQGPLPEPGSKLQKDGKELGEITSAATLPMSTGPRSVALGYVRREAAASGTGLTANGATATVTELPFQL